MIQASAQSEVMHRKILRSSVVGAHGIAADPADFSLEEQFHRLHGKPGKMHAALRILIAIFLRIWPPRSPAGPQQYNRSLRNPPVRLFPCFDTRAWELIVGVLGSLRA